MLTKFRIPEIVLGALLAVGIFAMGAVFQSSLPPPNQQEEQGGTQSTEKSAAHVAGPNSPDERIANYTWWLSVFTLALVVVSGVQGYFLLRADGTARIVADAASAQADIAKKALTDLERPYVFVFNVGRLETEQYTVFDEENFSEEIQLSITYSVANHGKIPAILTRVKAGLHVSGEPRIPDPLPDSHSLVVSPIIAASDTRPEIIAMLNWDNFGTGEYGETVPNFGDDKSLFFWIVITYRGPFTGGHETSACWRCNESTNRFIRLNDPKYNYEK